MQSKSNMHLGSDFYLCSVGLVGCGKLPVVQLPVDSDSDFQLMLIRLWVIGSLCRSSWVSLVVRCLNRWSWIR